MQSYATFDEFCKVVANLYKKVLFAISEISKRQKKWQSFAKFEKILQNVAKSCKIRKSSVKFDTFAKIWPSFAKF